MGSGTNRSWRKSLGSRSGRKAGTKSARRSAGNAMARLRAAAFKAESKRRANA
jgi:hypothetical protein